MSGTVISLLKDKFEKKMQGGLLETNTPQFYLVVAEDEIYGKSPGLACKPLTNNSTAYIFL